VLYKYSFIYHSYYEYDSNYAKIIHISPTVTLSFNKMISLYEFRIELEDIIIFCSFGLFSSEKGKIAQFTAYFTLPSNFGKIGEIHVLNLEHKSSVSCLTQLATQKGFFHDRMSDDYSLRKKYLYKSRTHFKGYYDTLYT